MGTSLVFVAILAANSVGSDIGEQKIEKQNQIFQKWWGNEMVWKFDDLPTKSKVVESRIPYSGHIYPDTAGGTVNALSKYDWAFNGRSGRAAAFERWDTTAFQEPESTRRGLFGLFAVRRMSTPHWHGHCNGWAAAAIRHAEPKQSVKRNGVVFTPADIKALLAEIYTYNDTQMLDGDGSYINAGTFHALLTNWLGRGKHPIGMEADPGKEKWNYPIYAYSTTFAKRGSNQVEVKMNAAYANSSNGEYQQSPRLKRIKYFHYMLELSDAGDIVGGYYYRDSSRIDMLWIPVSPKQGRQPGNERGNPHVDVNEVLAIWRASVPQSDREIWPCIDASPQDRLFANAEIDGLKPLTDFSVTVAKPVVENQSTDGDAATEGTADTIETPVAENAAVTTVDSSETNADAVSLEAAAEENAVPTTTETTSVEG
ncbi:MAG: hypothetical protein QF918_11470 [Pirellulaceae bacterium]|jgi:hypothetical protein|nr:hypothetical protein [Pirellulaceae bacterium]MDP6558346.1 hypothetical protein [Pirellulaceae bacterium]